MSGLDVVVRYRKGYTYGHHTILAALEVEPPPVPHDVHLCRSWEDVVTRIEAGVEVGRRVLVAWSFYSPDAAAMAAELAAVRAALCERGHGPDVAGGPAPADPHERPEDLRVLHVAGGVHATAEPLVTLRAGWDAVAVGEGEHTFTALCAALASGQDWRRVPGTTHLGAGADLLAGDHPGHGRLVKAGPAVRRDLDAYPAFPVTRNLTNPIEITRGCVYACKFCQTPFMFSARFRHRSVASVREAVRVMRGRGLRDVRFITPTSLSYGTQGGDPDLDAVEELLAVTKEEIGPTGRVFFGSFPSELRPEHVSAEALRMIARYAHNRDVIIGAQSGSEDVLAGSGRGHGAAIVEDAVRLAVQEGFRPNVDLIFGMPGEGPEEALATVAMMKRLTALGARMHAHTFMPLPGTPWRNEPAGVIAPEARRELAAMTTSGRVYGSWEKQEGIAAEMAAVRATDPGYRAGRPRRLREAAGDAVGGGD
ncbi:MAG: TIGR04013 family B12-binding domain/radical SAM domain-containing protein [Kineosporiaceae bacterium]